MGVTVEHLLRLKTDVAEGLEAAQAESAELRKELKRLQEELDDTGKKGKRTGDKLEDIGDQAGDLDTILQGLAGILGQFSPALEGVARTGGDAAAGVEAASRATKLLGSPVGAAAAGMAVLTASLVGAAGAAFGLVVAAEDLHESLVPLQGTAGIQLLPPGQLQAIQQAARSIDAVKAVGAEVATILAGDLAPAVRDVSVLVVAFSLAFRDMVRDFTEGEDILRTLAEAFGVHIVKVLTFPLNAISKIMGAWGSLINLVTSENKGVQALFALGLTGDELARLREVGQGLQDIRKDYMAFAGDLAGQGVSTVFKGIGDAVGDLTERSRDYVDQATRLIGTLQVLRGEASDLSAVINQQFGDAQNFGSGGFSGASFDSGIESFGPLATLRGQLTSRATILRGRLEDSGALGRLQTGAGVVGGLAQGDPSALLGALGPAGAAIGGLAAIGKAGGADGVSELLEGFEKAIFEGVEALPEILLEIIPPFIQALVLDLPPALAQALWEILRELIGGGEDSVFTQEGRQTRLGNIRDAINQTAQGGNLAALAFAGATGGRTPDTQARLAAQTAPGFNLPAATRIQTGSMAPQFNFYADVIDRDAVGRFMDRASVELGKMGSRQGMSLAGEG